MLWFNFAIGYNLVQSIEQKKDYSWGKIKPQHKRVLFFTLIASFPDRYLDSHQNHIFNF